MMIIIDTGVDVIESLSLSGIAVYETGNIGQIKSVSIAGVGKFNPVIGKVVAKTVAGTGIDTATIT